MLSNQTSSSAPLESAQATKIMPGREAQAPQQQMTVVSEDFAEMPIIDLDLYMQGAQSASPSEAALIECKKVAECFHQFGIILIRDPRVNMQDNDQYIDLMEQYFSDIGDKFYANEPIDDIKPEFHYQVGATPEYIEKARGHAEKLSALNLTPEDTPGSPLEPVLDAKWRFMWKIGQRPEGASDDFP